MLIGTGSFHVFYLSFLFTNGFYVLRRRRTGGSIWDTNLLVHFLTLPRWTNTQYTDTFTPHTCSFYFFNPLCTSLLVTGGSLACWLFGNSAWKGRPGALRCFDFYPCFFFYWRVC